MTHLHYAICLLILVLSSLAPRSLSFAFSPTIRDTTQNMPFKYLTVQSSSINCPTANSLLNRRVLHHRCAIPTPPLFAEANDNDNDETNVTLFLKGLKSFYSKKEKANRDSLSTKERMAKLGLAVLLSYGFVSNMSAMIFLSLSWFSFSAKVSCHFMSLVYIIWNNVLHQIIHNCITLLKY